jgi:hypothetical protein
MSSEEHPMRRFLPTAVAVVVACVAAPALALTISPAPNRDQAAHLNQQRSPGGGVDLRDTLAGSGRPQGGLDFLGSQGDYRRTQNYSFGNVTTSITTGRPDLLPSFIDQDPRRPYDRFDNRFGAEVIGRHR